MEKLYGLLAAAGIAAVILVAFVWLIGSHGKNHGSR